MKETHPSIIDEAYKILLPKDFIRAKLTDTFFTDVGDAGGTQMYDHNTGGWNYKIADFIGIPHHKLPDIYPPEKVVGSVTNRAAKETGLAPETPVITGVADARIDPIRRAMAGLIPEGCILIYIGTAPSISAYTTEGKLISGSFLGPGGGASKKWFKEQFGFVETKISELVQTNSFELLDKEAEQVEPGSGGLLFLPHMMGERSPMAGDREVPNPYARGVLFGLCLGHKRQHIIRAIMEGVAYQLRIGWDSIKERNPGLELKSAMIYGGGAKSRLWRWIIANVFGFPVHLVSEEEVSALMCACSVAVGLGMYSDISEAVQNLRLTLIDVIKPHTSYVKKYTKLYELYRGVQNDLTKSFNATSLIEEYG
jgi:xylulokinase